MVDSILRKCTSCGRYTLRRDRCPACGSKVSVPHPPKYSPEDKYGRYRLLMRVLSGELGLGEEAVSKILSSLGHRAASSSSSS